MTPPSPEGHDRSRSPFSARRRDTAVGWVATKLAQVSGAVLLALFAINIVQILARPLMGGWIWVNDLSRLLIIWVLMLGAAAAIGLREHLVIDALADHLPPRVRSVSAYVVRALEVAMGFILLVSGSVVAMDRMSIEYIQLGLPTGFAYLAIPVLGFFMLAFGLVMSVGSSPAPAVDALSEGSAGSEGDDR